MDHIAKMTPSTPVARENSLPTIFKQSQKGALIKARHNNLFEEQKSVDNVAQAVSPRNELAESFYNPKRFADIRLKMGFRHIPEEFNADGSPRANTQTNDLSEDSVGPLMRQHKSLVP